MCFLFGGVRPVLGFVGDGVVGRERLGFSADCCVEDVRLMVSTA